MTDIQQIRAELKPRLVEYVETITNRSRGARNQYICPIPECRSGTGKHKTGAFTVYDPEHWKCHACGAGGDIFDLIGAVEGIADAGEQVRRACQILGVSAPQGRQQGAQPRQARKVEQEPSQDFTAFFRACAERLDGAADYLASRGISLETARQYGLGYDPAWRHPKSPATVPTSPRLIIPTSPGSYLARDVREEIPEAAKQYAKSKAGATRIFNLEAVYTAAAPVYIVEGELDALSIVEAGGHAVGLGSVGMARAFLDTVDARRPAQPLILALDNDPAGQKASAELEAGLKRLGVDCWSHNPSGTHKDPNEALQCDREAFVEAVHAGERVQAEQLEAERAAYRQGSAAAQLDQFFSDLERAAGQTAIPTGFPALDKILDGGFYPGLYIMGAISSLGKTTLALQLGDTAARAGHDVLIFSLEMSRAEVIAKSLSRLTFERSGRECARTTRQILTAGKRCGAWSEEERAALRAARASYREYAENVYILEGRGDIGTYAIRDAVQRHVTMTGNTPLVIVDYLQIITPADARATDKQNTDRAVTDLKRISRDFSAPVLAISSFNRDNYTAPVSMAAFKESGAIEYSSDVLLALQYEGMDYRDGENDKKRTARIHELTEANLKAARAGEGVRVQCKVLKNRNGDRGGALLDFFPMFNTYRSGR